MFALVCGLISLPLSVLVAPAGPQTGNGSSSERLFSSVLSMLSGAGQPEVALGVLFLAILLPLTALVGTILGLYVTAGIQHLLVLLFVRPTNTDFETTFRVVAYASVTLLLSWIPLVGPLAGLYGLYLTFVGIREMHQTSDGRALTAISLPAVLMVSGIASSFAAG